MPAGSFLWQPQRVCIITQNIKHAVALRFVLECQRLGCQPRIPCVRLSQCLLSAPAPGCTHYDACRFGERMRRDKAALADLNAWTATLSAEQRAAFDAASSTDTFPAGPLSPKVTGPASHMSRRPSDKMYLTATGELVTQAALCSTLLRSNTTAVLLNTVPAEETLAVPSTGDVRAQNWSPECDIQKGLATRTGLICGKGGAIAIRGGNGGQWCSAEVSEWESVVRCNRYEQGSWEVFQATSSRWSRDWYTLRSMSSQLVCGATPETTDNPYDGGVSCNHGTVAKRTDNFRFTQILCGQAGDRKPIGWSITTRANKFCCDDWDSTLRCDRGTLATWEVHSVFCWKVASQQWQECTAC